MSVDLSDNRRFLELAELYLDHDLSRTETAELRTLLEADATLVHRLHTLMRDQVVCRTALRPADPTAIGERTRRMLDSWRPQSGEIAAQAVFARVDQGRRMALILRWSSLAAAALVMVLVVPLLAPFFLRPVAQPDALAPSVSAVAGDVRLGDLALSAAGDRLGFSSTLTVGAAGSATLTWSDGTRLDLGHNSTLTRLPAAGQLFKLDGGSVSVIAAKRAPDQPLEIICPDSTVRVVGTRFTVVVTDGRSELSVTEGLVRHQRLDDGVWSLVGVGQRVTTARLPLPSPVLMSVEHLAALKTAIASGRQPFASALAALHKELPRFQAEPVLEERVITVTRYRGPRTELHSRARSLLHQLCRPMVGLALWSRLTDDEVAGRAALARIRVAMELRLEDEEADLLMSDMLAVYVPQAADLLRNQRWWDTEDSQRMDRWLRDVVQPAAERLSAARSASQRWRGVAALMSLHAWRGERERIIALMAEVRAEMPALLSPAMSSTLAARPEDDSGLYQIMAHALLCADLARVAAGDITPPPPAWNTAVDAFLQRLERLSLPAERQEMALGRALAGPAPWRSPAALPLAQDGDTTDHSYGWYFPVLLLLDPRWQPFADSP
jgi:FecR protein